MAKFIISICRRQFQLQNEPVHLVDADGDGHTLLNGVFDQTLRVEHHLGRDTQRSGLHRRLKKPIYVQKKCEIGRTSKRKK